MKVALHETPEQPMPQPENIVAVQINSNNGLLTKNEQSKKTITEYFRNTDIPAMEEESNVNSENMQAQDNQETLF
jgi:membrane carboxypeptidase/penicillin-binding protein